VSKSVLHIVELQSVFSVHGAPSVSCPPTP